MIKRKVSTPKSFRIDNRLLEYAAVLADSTERSLNDIVELGLAELIKKNSLYFIRNELFVGISMKSNCGYEEAGLYFKYDKGKLYFFTKNINQQVVKPSINILKSLKCYDEDKNFIKSVEEKMGYKLFDFICYDDISVNKDNTKINGWINLLEAHFELIDQNFPEMQDWIDKKFDFS